MVQLPESKLKTSVSLIVPTYHEVENLPQLLARVSPLLNSFDRLELILVDDNSQDGTAEYLAKANLPWVRLIVRTTDRGLSQSVVEGIRQSTHEVIVVMDADLSHPPEVIPQMVLKALDHEMAIGSRYVKGGGLDENWTVYRWLNSKVATLLARPFTRVRDPMSGFFAFRRSYLKGAADLNPVGYKIGLEVIVKCDFQDVVEVPIFFSDRKFGQSKLSLREHIAYLRHIKRLADFKFGHLSYAAQFLFVGATGTLVNLAIVTLLNLYGVAPTWSVGFGIGISLTTNFVLNRSVTFTYAKHENIVRQYVKYALANSIGITMNYAVAYELIRRFSIFKEWPQVPALVGIVAGVGFNFLTSRMWVFRTPVKSSPQNQHS